MPDVHGPPADVPPATGAHRCVSRRRRALLTGWRGGKGSREQRVLCVAAALRESPSRTPCLTLSGSRPSSPGSLGRRPRTPSPAARSAVEGNVPVAQHSRVEASGPSPACLRLGACDIRAHTGRCGARAQREALRCWRRREKGESRRTACSVRRSNCSRALAAASAAAAAAGPSAASPSRKSSAAFFALGLGLREGPGEVGSGVT